MSRSKDPDFVNRNEFAEPMDLVAINAEERQIKNELDEIKSAFGDEQRAVTARIHERIGRKQVITAVQKMLMVSDLIDLQNIKETKAYKNLEIIIDEKLLTVRTFEEYCLHVEKRSRQAVDLDLDNFKQLGEEFFEAMRNIGIGPGTMRNLRKLPEDERAGLLEMAQAGDKDSFIDLAESLISKHQKEKEILQKNITDKSLDLEAKDRVIKDKSELLNKKVEQIARLEAEKKLEVQEQYMPGQIELEALQRYSTQVAAQVSASMRSAIVKLFNVFDGDDLPEHVRLAAAQSLGLVITAAYGVANDLGLSINTDPETAAEDPAKADFEEFSKWQATQASGE